MASVNRSVWQEKAGVLGDIREAPLPKISDDQILVKAHAWALNPADHMVQDIPLPFITYPLILGEDVAGTVEQVGSKASSKFKVGDRVVGLALGAAVSKPEQGAFQEYVVHEASLACKIPDSLSFTNASVFPLCLATAAHGLFSKSYLGLPFPTVDYQSNGKSILVWGGSSAVGCNAIQLCKHVGYEVITTCSARNSDLVKSLGASQVFDHNSPTVIDDVAAALDKGTCVGILQAAGPAKPAIDVSAKSKQKLFVATSNMVMEGDAVEGVDAKMIFAEGGAVIYHETEPATFGKFLPEALAKGVYQVAPPVEVVKTKGVEGIQEGLDLLKKGVSAKKIVIEAK